MQCGSRDACAHPNKRYAQFREQAEWRRTPLLNLAHSTNSQAALRIWPLTQTPSGAQPGGVLVSDPLTMWQRPCFGWSADAVGSALFSKAGGARMYRLVLLWGRECDDGLRSQTRSELRWLNSGQRCNGSKAASKTGNPSGRLLTSYVGPH